MKCNIIFFLFAAVADVEVRSSKTSAPEVGLCNKHEKVNKVYLFKRGRNGEVAINEVSVESGNDIAKMEKTLESLNKRLEEIGNNNKDVKEAIDNLNRNIENSRKIQEKVEKEKSQEKEKIEKVEKEKQQEKERKKKILTKKIKNDLLYDEEDEEEDIEVMISPEMERLNRELERSHKTKMEEIRQMRLVQQKEYELGIREKFAMNRLMEMRRNLEFKKELEEQNLTRKNLLFDMKMRDELTNSVKNTLRQQVASSVNLNLTAPANGVSTHMGMGQGTGHNVSNLQISGSIGAVDNKQLEETKQYFQKMVEEKDKEIIVTKDEVNILKEELKSKIKEIEEQKNKIKEVIHQSSGSNEATKELMLQKELLSNLIKEKESLLSQQDQLIKQKEEEIIKLKQGDKEIKKYEDIIKQKELEIERLKTLDTSSNTESMQKYENLLKNKDEEVLKLQEMIKQFSDKIAFLENKLTLQDNNLNKQQIEELISKEVVNYKKEMDALKEKMQRVVKKNEVLEKLNQQYTELLQKLSKSIQ